MSDNEHYVNRDPWAGLCSFSVRFRRRRAPPSQRLGVGCVNFFLALADRNFAA
jgi:hypothetical protein